MIPDYILSEIKWGVPHKPVGGQQCGMQYPTITLSHEESGFSCTVESGLFRSQHRTREFLLTVFELFLEESRYI